MLEASAMTLLKVIVLLGTTCTPMSVYPAEVAAQR